MGNTSRWGCFWLTAGCIVYSLPGYVTALQLFTKVYLISAVLIYYHPGARFSIHRFTKFKSVLSSIVTKATSATLICGPFYLQTTLPLPDYAGHGHNHSPSSQPNSSYIPCGRQGWDWMTSTDRFIQVPDFCSNLIGKCGYHFKSGCLKTGQWGC